MAEEVPLGALLRRHRRAAGLTLEELAERSGVSPRAISEMERGRTRAPQRRTLESLIGALSVQPPDRAAVLSAATAARERRAPRVSGFCELPRGVADFTARENEMETLRKLAAVDQPGAVVLISGPPGTGKTALAIRVAEILGGSFGDGQFFVDLRGLSDHSLTAADAASRLLRALGVAESRVPADEADRADYLRGLLRQRRSLIILDNAASEGQIRELLPAEEGRYSFHDLVRLFARERLEDEDSTADRQAAVDRMVCWLLEVAVAAGRWFGPGAGPAGAGPSAPGDLESAAGAVRWLRTEGENWLGALRLAAAAGDHARVVAVAEALHRFANHWVSWRHWDSVFGLVYIAAFGLDQDESIGALLSSGPVTPALEHMITDQQGFGWLSEDDFVHHFAGDVEPATAKVMYAVQQPLALSAFGTAMGVPAWKSLATWYLVAGQDEAIPPDAERQSAGRMGATTVEIASGHVAMVSHPDAVTDLIKTAAAAG